MKTRTTILAILLLATTAQAQDDPYAVCIEDYLRCAGEVAALQGEYNRCAAEIGMELANITYADPKPIKEPEQFCFGYLGACGYHHLAWWMRTSFCLYVRGER